MKSVFEFSDPTKYEIVIQRTWAKFRQQLANKEFLYNDLESAKNSTFLRVFDDLFSHCHIYLEKSVANILRKDPVIVRAAQIVNDNSIPGYDRFIPKAEFIKDDNRFSPSGTEWLYLAIGPNLTSGDFLISEKCALKECKANAGDKFALCRFRVDEKYSQKMLIDLTISKSYDFNHINRNLEEKGKLIVTREYSRMSQAAFATGVIPKPRIEDIKSELKKWIAFTYTKLLSDQIFLPVTTEDRSLMYAPFQCMAQYFLNKGYVGIVYSSTVFPAGKNIVLFDKSIAIPYGEIKKVEVPAGI